MIEIVGMSVFHIESFRDALDAVCRERKFLSMLEAPPLEATRAFVQGMLLRGDVTLVALAGHRVVGWCDIQRSDRPALAHSGTLGIGLLAAYRGQGIGRQLITQALVAAVVMGLARVDLTVRADNAPAIALYESVGFGHEGRLRRAVRIDGSEFDLLAMACLLDELAEA